jgi:hypothetical protein
MNFHENLSSGSQLFHADGRTDTQMMKLRVASHNVVNSPKRGRNYKVYQNFLIDIFFRMFSYKTRKDGVVLLN